MMPREGVFTLKARKLLHFNIMSLHEYELVRALRPWNIMEHFHRREWVGSVRKGAVRVAYHKIPYPVAYQKIPYPTFKYKVLTKYLYLTSYLTPLII